MSTYKTRTYASTNSEGDFTTIIRDNERKICHLIYTMADGTFVNIARYDYKKPNEMMLLLSTIEEFQGAHRNDDALEKLIEIYDMLDARYRAEAEENFLKHVETAVKLLKDDCERFPEKNSEVHNETSYTKFECLVHDIKEPSDKEVLQKFL